MRAIRRTYSYVPIPLLIRGLTSTVLFHHDYYYYYPGLIARIISLSPSKLGFAAPPPNFRPQPENSTPTRVLVLRLSPLLLRPLSTTSTTVERRNGLVLRTVLALHGFVFSISPRLERKRERECSSRKSKRERSIWRDIDPLLTGFRRYRFHREPR